MTKALTIKETRKAFGIKEMCYLYIWGYLPKHIEFYTNIVNFTLCIPQKKCASVWARREVGLTGITASLRWRLIHCVFSLHCNLYDGKKHSDIRMSMRMLTTSLMGFSLILHFGNILILNPKSCSNFTVEVLIPLLVAAGSF